MEPLAQGYKRGAQYPALLLKTGQTTQYDTQLDDGYYEKGVAKAYSILTTGQYLGTTNITINGKTDAHSNNCVFDTNTGLMWSRYASGGVGPSSSGILPWTTNGDGEGIFTYCAAANVAGLGGYSDWRIPNFIELLSISDCEAPNGYPDSTVFPSFPTTNIWSSSTRTGNTASAIHVSYNVPNTDTTLKTTAYKTMLVRGG